MSDRRKGRRKGSRNKGYFYRKARNCWYTKDGPRFVALTDESGQRLSNPNVDKATLQDACARFRATQRQAPKSQEPCATILEVVRAYLAKAGEEYGENKTFHDRARALFNFTHGLPNRFRKRGKPKKTDYIHPGYGDWPACKLTPLDVDQWLQVNKEWVSASTKRFKLKALIRALNYAASAKLIPANPIRGYKVPKSRGRITYITPEQEAALISGSNPALAQAIKVLIRTGMRPGIEFAAVTARHVKDDGERIQIVFAKEETKTRKKTRTILVTDPAIMAIIRQQVKANPTGPIFRTVSDRSWEVKNMSKRFRDIRDKLIKAGMDFDKDCVLYSTRHTYAKRILEGYWSGRSTSIETLARLMGNTPQICRDHYLQWDKASTDFLWQSA